MEAQSHEFYSLNLHYIQLFLFTEVKTPNSYNIVYIDVNPSGLLLLYITFGFIRLEKDNHIFQVGGCSEMGSTVTNDRGDNVLRSSITKEIKGIHEQKLLNLKFSHKKK